MGQFFGCPEEQSEPSGIVRQFDADKMVTEPFEGKRGRRANSPSRDRESVRALYREIQRRTQLNLKVEAAKRKLAMQRSPNAAPMTDPRRIERERRREKERKAREKERKKRRDRSLSTKPRKGMPQSPNDSSDRRRTSRTRERKPSRKKTRKDGDREQTNGRVGQRMKARNLTPVHEPEEGIG